MTIASKRTTTHKFADHGSAGAGHQLVPKSQEFVVIGAYPPNGTYDLCRGSKAEHDRALAAIPNVPPLPTDPVFGASGPLMKLGRA